MPRDGEQPISKIRLLTEADIPWALDLAEKCYLRKLDRDIWTDNVSRALKNPCVKIVRGDESVVVCEIYYEVPGHPDIHGKFHYWFHRGDNPREIVRCFEAAISWMGRAGAKEIHLSPHTGVDATPLARILGFDKAYPGFLMKVGHA